MKTGFFAIVAALGATFAGPSSGQSLSAADILGKVEQKTQATNEYQKLLNDPDPARSMAAMEVMLESGDTQLQRMALEFGIYSPNPVVKRLALEGHLKTQPVFSIVFDGSKLKANEIEQLKNHVSGLGGSVNDGQKGFASIKVGDFDAAEACYKESTHGKCLFRLDDRGQAIRILQTWIPLAFNDNGELSGVGLLPYMETPVGIVVPVSQ